MEISTILLIYLAVAFVVSIICVIWCVVENDLDMDGVHGIVLLSLLWPVALVPFFALILFQRLKSRKVNK